MRDGIMSFRTNKTQQKIRACPVSFNQFFILAKIYNQFDILIL